MNLLLEITKEKSKKELLGFYLTKKQRLDFELAITCAQNFHQLILIMARATYYARLNYLYRIR